MSINPGHVSGFFSFPPREYSYTSYRMPFVKTQTAAGRAFISVKPNLFRHLAAIDNDPVNKSAELLADPAHRAPLEKQVTNDTCSIPAHATP